MLLSALAHAAPALVHLKDLERVPRVELAGPDRLALFDEDLERADIGLPQRFADAREVAYSPDTDGAWEELSDGSLMWRLRVAAPGAAHLNLGFGRYHMPADGTLQVSSPGGLEAIARPFTERDNAEHGELWTPVLLADEAVIEVVVPAGSADELELSLTTIGVGYRGFGAAGDDKAGWCNVDVTCEEGDDWWDEIPSVAVMAMGGGTFCTGFLVNNVEEDQTPYFQTAQHCGVGAYNAASLVVYWNYERAACGDGRGRLDRFTSGATHVVSGSASDFTLVLLDEVPDPDFEVTWAGFDATGADAETAVAIHHPSTDEKAISVSYGGTSRTGYYSYGGGESHVMVASWDVGTTESGSSGSPLFDQDHRVIGQLHGGYASCGNDDADWYGSLATSWEAGLSDHLDPEGTGARVVDTLVPWARGLEVTPESGWSAQGPAGGPFTPEGARYTLENPGEEALDFVAEVDASWVVLSEREGVVPPGESVELELALVAGAMPTGRYAATLSVRFEDDEELREVTLEVGEREAIVAWDMEDDPAWEVEGGWAWGIPSGGRGSGGWPDPTAGATGERVFGYELDGGYAADLDETHLVAGPIDLGGYAGTSLRLSRWLGVEGPPYDHASVAVSADGSSWETVWEADGEVDDGAWVELAYDLSAWDGEPELRIRWTMGATDRDVEYCGWNLDDIVVSGILAGVPPASDPGSAPEEAACAGCSGAVASGWLGLLVVALPLRRRASRDESARPQYTGGQSD